MSFKKNDHVFLPIWGNFTKEFIVMEEIKKGTEVFILCAPTGKHATACFTLFKEEDLYKKKRPVRVSFFISL